MQGKMSILFVRININMYVKTFSKHLTYWLPCWLHIISMKSDYTTVCADFDQWDYLVVKNRYIFHFHSNNMVVPNCQIDAVYKIQNTYDVIWGLTPTCSGAHEAIERDRQRHLPRCILYVRKQKSCLSHDLDLSILIIESGGNPSNHCTTIR